MKPAALRAIANAARALADGAQALAELADAAASEAAGDPDEQVSEADAAKLACVSIHRLRVARRAGALTFYGPQRSRSVRRGDLLRWIEAQRVAAGDDDVDARMQRIERARRTA
jgi:hypothetical protein